MSFNSEKLTALRHEAAEHLDVTLLAQQRLAEAAYEGRPVEKLAALVEDTSYLYMAALTRFKHAIRKELE